MRLGGGRLLASPGVERHRRAVCGSSDYLQLWTGDFAEHVELRADVALQLSLLPASPDDRVLPVGSADAIALLPGAPDLDQFVGGGEPASKCWYSSNRNVRIPTVILTIGLYQHFEVDAQGGVSRQLGEDVAPVETAILVGTPA